jgi:hypothetical protein
MTKLHESLRIQCPYLRAKEQLRAALQQAAQSGVPQTLQLSAVLPATNLALAKNVRVTYGPAVDPMHFDEPWRVQWAPEAGGIYPSFDGKLTVRADERYESAILELDGEYRPPLGAAGRAFDAALGHKIASDTAQRLLEKLASQMITCYESEEAGKAHHAESRL